MDFHRPIPGVQLDPFSDPFPKNALGEEYSNINNVLVDGGSHFGVSALCFDRQEELIWMGNRGGHVTSYYTSELQKHTSFQIHATEEIRQLLTIDSGVLSLTSTLLKLNKRRGLIDYSFVSPHMTAMQCMSLLPASERLLLGGAQSLLLQLDLNTGQEETTVDIGPSGCAIIRHHPRFVCFGDYKGKITLRDPNSLSVEHTFEAHSGTLSDFDVHGNLLLTCGFSSRHGEMTCDRLLMVYDVRMMRNMTPIQILFPPVLLRFLPAFSSRLCVVSQMGQFQLMDIGNSGPTYPHQVDTSGQELLSFDTSSSCQALAFGDNAGYLHLYGASDNINFNTYSRQTEFADTVESLAHIDITDEITPLSSIPMPHCTGKLLSDWPPHLIKPVYRRTPPTDPQILNSMKMVGSIGYAPNPGNRLRNQMPYVSSSKSSKDSSPSSPDEEEPVPLHYLKIELKVNRMAYEEIDFNKYNRTSFAGLEANLPNSYNNNMIQVLYYVEPLRSTIINHQCEREFCLSCELSFLFHMLDTAQGLPCQANNFLRAFRTIPEASALGLIVNDLAEARKKCNLPRLVQSWTRFILQQINTEMGGNSDPEQDTASENDPLKEKLTPKTLFGGTVMSINKCKCSSEMVQSSISLICSLNYPENASGNTKSYTFCEVLQRSLSLEQPMHTWCNKCEKYQYMKHTRKYTELPDILVITCGLENNADITFWKQQQQQQGVNDITPASSKQIVDSTLVGKKACRYGNQCARPDCKFYHVPTLTSQKSVGSWIPSRMILKNQDGEITAKEYEEGAPFNETYELSAIVSVVSDLKEQGRDNIISCIKVGPSYHTRLKGSAFSQWYLFNDFCILPLTEDEALRPYLEWKTPCVLYFSRTNLDVSHPPEARKSLTAQVFFEDVSLAAQHSPGLIAFTPLTPSEALPSLVAMDAEFVTLNQEEAEYRSDGTRSTIRPGHFSVARISCIRGDGPLEGVPFIDDYISTQEQVVDYVTKFSGIKPGDLDATVSSKHLTTLKRTYHKLRFLIDSGVKFVGHGLKNDFRVINLVVPPEQVLDTVHLFQIPNRRMVSLRFLAWHFLDLRIQSETHDSIEDAKTALQLYKKYKQLVAEGTFKDALKNLYDTGRSLQWKVPKPTM